MAGNNVIEEKLGLNNFKILNDVELPIHPIMASKLYARIEELCDVSKVQNVLHLNSGVGALSCMLALQARQVYALEESSSFAHNLEFNLKHNNTSNVRVMLGKLYSSLCTLQETSVQVCVAHAPRYGLGDSLVGRLCAFAPSQIIYTSSFTDKMCEDLKLFSNYNYYPVFIEPFDTYPGTANFDVLCYLKRM